MLIISSVKLTKLNALLLDSIKLGVKFVKNLESKRGFLDSLPELAQSPD